MENLLRNDDCYLEAFIKTVQYLSGLPQNADILFQTEQALKFFFGFVAKSRN